MAESECHKVRVVRKGFPLQECSTLLSPHVPHGMGYVPHGMGYIPHGMGYIPHGMGYIPHGMRYVPHGRGYISHGIVRATVGGAAVRNDMQA